MSDSFCGSWAMTAGPRMWDNVGADYCEERDRRRTGGRIGTRTGAGGHAAEMAAVLITC